MKRNDLFIFCRNGKSQQTRIEVQFGNFAFPVGLVAEFFIGNIGHQFQAGFGYGVQRESTDVGFFSNNIGQQTFLIVFGCFRAVQDVLQPM